jgi:hypothetical protein
MKNPISKFNVGESVTWFEDFNEVVAVILDVDNGGASLAATSLSFGAEDVDYVYLPAQFKVAKWVSELPEILQDEI